MNEPHTGISKMLEILSGMRRQLGISVHAMGSISMSYLFA